MSYRDDREALHRRVEQLETELADARQQGERAGRDQSRAHAAELERRLAQMRGEMERMTGELRRLQGGQPPPAPTNHVPLALGAALGMTVLVGSAAFFLIQSTRRTVSPPAVTAPVVDAPTRPAAEVPEIPSHDPPAPPPDRPATPAPRARVERTTTARWNATVTRASGSSLKPGATCVVEASIVTDETETNALVEHLTVGCGATKLYDSSDGFSGMSQSSNDARETLGASDDGSTFTLSYQDIGTRTGDRAQIDLKSRYGQARIFRDAIPAFDVALSLPAQSARTTPLHGAGDRLKRTGTVDSVTGMGVAKGASCTLRAMPTGEGDGCVAELRCGTKTVWPVTDAVVCRYDGALPSTVEGDAARGADNALNLTDTTLSVTRGKGSMTVTLDP